MNDSNTPQALGPIEPIKARVREPIPAKDLCKGALGTMCEDPDCDKDVCMLCGRHICPVDNRHYKIMIYADTLGCTTECYKLATGDTKPWQPPGVRSVVE